MAAVSANKLELLQIADAVAREKSIDRSIVISANGGCHRQGGSRALRLRRRTCMPRSIRRPASCSLPATCSWSIQVENYANQIIVEGRATRQSRRAGRRHDRRYVAAAGIRTHRRAIRQTGYRAKGARGRARPAVSGIQGSHWRDRQRHRQARRIWQRHRRSRPWRSHHAPRRNAAARSVPQRRPRALLHFRRAPRNPRPADFSVTHPSAVHGQAVRAGSAGNL